MHIVVNRVEFLKRLRMVEKSITENKIKPILSCVYMETRGDELFLCGTNLETTITTTLPCKECLEEGSVAFQYALIDEYLKELKEEEVKLKLEGDVLSIEGGDAVSEFAIFSAEDYPKAFQNFETQETKHIMSMSSVELAGIFDKLKFSAGSADNPTIHCLRMEGEEGYLHFVTTDSYRLTYMYKEYPIQDKFQVSIPLEAVEACTKIFRGEEEEVKVYLDRRFLRFVMKDVEIITSLIELAFPKYQGILQNGSYDKEMLLTAGELSNILRRVMIFVRNNEESKYGATFHLEDDLLKINGVSDIAKINEEIPVNFAGDSLKVALNTKYLFEFVQNVEKETEMSLEFLNSKSSVKVQVKGKDDYIYILMPLALKEA